MAELRVEPMTQVHLKEKTKNYLAPLYKVFLLCMIKLKIEFPKQMYFYLLKYKFTGRYSVSKIAISIWNQ